VSEERRVRKGLVAVRRRDRAEAIGALRDAERRLAGIERELADVRARRETTGEAIRGAHSGRVVTAARLASAALRRGSLEEKLEALAGREGELLRLRDAARKRLEEAVDEAASAHKAFAAVGASEAD
jgi:chromosome segregation ATPase